MIPYRFWLVREAMAALGPVPAPVYKAVAPLAGEVVKSWSLTNGGEKLSVVFERRYEGDHALGLRVLEAALLEVGDQEEWALVLHTEMGKGGLYKSRTGGATCGLYDAGYVRLVHGPNVPQTRLTAPAGTAPAPARRKSRMLRKRVNLARVAREQAAATAARSGEAVELERIEIRRDAKNMTASVYIDGLLLLDAYLDLGRGGWVLFDGPETRRLRHMTYKSLADAIRHIELVTRSLR